MPSKKHVLFIDAYDSFSESIAALIQQLLAVKVSLIRVDSWTVTGTLHDRLSEGPSLRLKPADERTYSHQNSVSPVRTFNLETIDYELLLDCYDAVVVGPGPGDPRNPADLGIISLLWKAAERCGVPILGICLGFQSLCLAYGASIVPLSEPCHGHVERILHLDQDIFAHVGLVMATNYHSLEVHVRTSHLSSLASRPSSARSSFSDQSVESEAQSCPNIQQLAWNEKGTLMAVRHSKLPFWGLQFHPESCQSNAACQDLIRNWWKAAMEFSPRRRQTYHFEISLSSRHADQTDPAWPPIPTGPALPKNRSSRAD